MNPPTQNSLIKALNEPTNWDGVVSVVVDPKVLLDTYIFFSFLWWGGGGVGGGAANELAICTTKWSERLTNILGREDKYIYIYTSLCTIGSNTNSWWNSWNYNQLDPDTLKHYALGHPFYWLHAEFAPNVLYFVSVGILWLLLHFGDSLIL